MAMTQTVELSNGAERMRRYRDRKRQGVVCVAQLPVYVLDVEMLVKHSRLKSVDQKDTAKISAAIEALVDDFTEGKLTATAGPLIGDGKSK